MLKVKGKFRGKKVGVLMGGPSGEREVSLRSGAAVLKALKERGYDAVSLDADQNLAVVCVKEKIEVCYNALHGTWGEDGLVQGILETARIAYTGSGVSASVLTMDKILTKKLLIAENLPTPEYLAVEKGEKFDVTKVHFAYPLVVKPAREGSSLGISICKTAGELPAALQVAFGFDSKVLIERFIAGRELTVGVVSGKSLPLVEIVPKKEFYDYESKYTPGFSSYHCPAQVEEKLVQEMQRIAERSCRLFRCRGGARVDFRLSTTDKPFIIELNTSPGMTELSLLPMAAKAAGFAFADLVELILDTADLEEQINWK